MQVKSSTRIVFGQVPDAIDRVLCRGPFTLTGVECRFIRRTAVQRFLPQEDECREQLARARPTKHKDDRRRCR